MEVWWFWIPLTVPTAVIIFLISLPGILANLVVTLVAKYVLSGDGGGWGRMLRSDSTMLASLGDKYSTLFCYLFEGTPDLGQILREFEEKILNARDNHGTLIYPELRQCVTPRLGFLFWKNCKEFRVENQIFEMDLHKGEPPLDLDSPSVLADLYHGIKWNWGVTPVWEILLCPRVQVAPCGNTTPHFALILRYHNSLGDVTSLQRMFDKVYTPSVAKILKPAYPPCFTSKRVWWKVPLDFAKLMDMMFRQGTIHFTNGKTPNCTLSVAANPVPIDTAVMKAVARKYGVSVTAVLVHLLASALRKLGTTQDVFAQFAVPLPGREERLYNYVGTSAIMLPCSVPTTTGRIRDSEARLKESYTSTIPLILTAGFTLFSIQPVWILRPVMESMLRTQAVTFTNLAWAPIPTKAFGGRWPLKEVKAPTVGNAGTKALSFVLLSSHGEFRLNLSADDGFVPVSKGMEIIEECVKEVERVAHVE